MHCITAMLFAKIRIIFHIFLVKLFVKNEAVLQPNIDFSICPEQLSITLFSVSSAISRSCFCVKNAILHFSIYVSHFMFLRVQCFWGESYKERF